jgi:hypothetical protein
MNFASLKIMCKMLATYQAFCNSFSTAQNSAVQCQMANRANHGRYYIHCWHSYYFVQWKMYCKMFGKMSNFCT